MSIDVEGRHPNVQHIARYFEYDHLRGELRETSAQVASLAAYMIKTLPDSPELVAGLRKLLEAKDCFVRAALDGVRS